MGEPKPLVPYIVRQAYVDPDTAPHTVDIWHDHPRADFLVEKLAEVPGVTNIDNDSLVRHGKHLFAYIDARYDPAEVIAALEETLVRELELEPAEEEPPEEPEPAEETGPTEETEGTEEENSE